MDTEDRRGYVLDHDGAARIRSAAAAPWQVVGVQEVSGHAGDLIRPRRGLGVRDPAFELARPVPIEDGR